MPQITYSELEKKLIEFENDLYYVDIYAFNELVRTVEEETTSIIGFGVELGRCPSTDVRTYTLHWSKDKRHYMEKFIGFIWLDVKDTDNIQEIHE